MIRFLRRDDSGPRQETGESNMGRFIPRDGGAHRDRGRAVWLVLLACVLLGAAPVGVRAQSSDNLRTYYIPARSFFIPFSIDQNDPGIEEILNFSTDGQNYRYHASAKPLERRFHYTAPADGLYYFIVQTRDTSGALTPPNLRGVPPSIRVCVDTQDPIIESFTTDASSDNALPTIRWKIVETNLKEVLADYRSTDSGGVWVPLFPAAKEQGEHTWKPTWSGELEVRIQAVDKAERRSEVRTLRLRVANNVTRLAPPQDQASAGKVLFSKSKTFQLNYALDDQTVGPSDVASVEIWKLHPGPGQVWRKCSEKGKRIGPATVSVESSGRWGFRLIPVSGVGLKERDPLPGDAPDIWVEVDDRPPQVRVTNVIVTPEADGGYLIVSWKADDAFLHSMPITIFLASPQGGDWTAVATNLPNTGSWRQKLAELNLGPRYEFALKVSAIDEAGNSGENQWHDTVKTDLRIPKIKHIEVKPGGAAANGQQSYPAAGTPPMGGYPFDSQPASKPTASPNNAKGTGFNSLVR
jgi:hypothetical protein